MNRNLKGGLFDGRGKPQPLQLKKKAEKIIIPEKHIQSSFIAWRDLFKRDFPILKAIFAVPNGLWTMNKAVAKNAVREGLTAGIQDVICLAPSADGKYPALLIEFKTESEKSVQSDEQIFFHHFLLHSDIELKSVVRRIKRQFWSMSIWEQKCRFIQDKNYIYTYFYV